MSTPCIVLQPKGTIRQTTIAGLNIADVAKVLRRAQHPTKVGEWIVEEIYQGKRAENGIQKYWDVDCSLGKIQVKTHAKGDKTSARWSNIKKIETKEIDHVVIIVFNKNYELQEFYNAPWAHVFSNIRQHKDTDRIFWDNLKDYKIPINELKQHKSLEIFLKHE